MGCLNTGNSLVKRFEAITKYKDGNIAKFCDTFVLFSSVGPTG